jgi:hypothetical protein
MDEGFATLPDLDFDFKPSPSNHLSLFHFAVQSSLLALLSLSLITALSHAPTPLPSLQPPLTLPFIVLDIHTSTSGIDRLATISRVHPLVSNGTIAIRFITSETLSSDCNDLRNGASGLVCRVEAAYSTFLRDYPSCPWLFRAMDDTVVRFDRLYSYVMGMSAVYDPSSHIVVKAHANFERGIRAYVHGGGGWLVSRAYVSYHVGQNHSLPSFAMESRYGQDDTAQTVVLDRLYRKAADWDEMLISGFRCANCGGEKLPVCPVLRVCARVSEVLAVHSFGASREGMRIAEIADRGDGGVMFWRDDDRQEIVICRRRWWSRRPYDPWKKGWVIGNAAGSGQ